jgi:hypothetical protein
MRWNKWMIHYTEFQCLKRDKDVSTTTLLVVAKRFIYATDRTDCILQYKLVKICVQSATCTVSYIGAMGSNLHSGQGGLLPCVVCFFFFGCSYRTCDGLIPRAKGLTVYKLES